MRPWRIVLALAVVVFSVVPASASESHGHVNFFLGQKILDSDDWDPIDQQPELGAILSFGRSGWPVFVAVDVMASQQEQHRDDPIFGTGTSRGRTVEIAPGVRKIWSTANAHPYLGGGLSVVAASREDDWSFGRFEADDVGIGGWVSGGIFWRLGNRFNLGFDLRWSGARATMDLGPRRGDDQVGVGGFHAGLTLGFGW